MSINNGFYESVINKLIDEEIHKLNQKKYYIDKKQIDEAEGSSILSKYMSIVIKKSLIKISSKDKINKQIDMCNKIISFLIDELGLHYFNLKLYIYSFGIKSILRKYIYNNTCLSCLNLSYNNSIIQGGTANLLR